MKAPSEPVSASTSFVSEIAKGEVESGTATSKRSAPESLIAMLADEEGLRTRARTLLPEESK